jgi:hypothetical protein
LSSIYFDRHIQRGTSANASGTANEMLSHVTLKKNNIAAAWWGSNGASNLQI